MILLIDNYDSFSYNLVQMIGSILSEGHPGKKGLQEEIRVARNDEITVEEVDRLHPSCIILSPGPKRPKDAGICEALIRELKGKYRMLGVCLGHQAICEVFGATITYAKGLMHGKQSVVRIDTSCPVFQGLSQEEPVARYHSLAADSDTIPECLMVTARDEHGEVMAVRHKEYEVYGLQFHPESVLTPNGKRILRNFILGGERYDQRGN